MLSWEIHVFLLYNYQIFRNLGETNDFFENGAFQSSIKKSHQKFRSHEPQTSAFY